MLMKIFLMTTKYNDIAKSDISTTNKWLNFSIYFGIATTLIGLVIIFFFANRLYSERLYPSTCFALCFTFLAYLTINGGVISYLLYAKEDLQNIIKTNEKKDPQTMAQNEDRTAFISIALTLFWAAFFVGNILLFFLIREVSHLV